MSVIPVLLDSRPPYVEGGAGPSSLLLLPFGAQPLLHHAVAQLGRVTSGRVIVVPTFEADGAYAAAVRAMHDGIGGVLQETELLGGIANYDPSDSLLIVDARYPMEDVDLRSFVAVVGDDAQIARHLLALAGTPERTKEYVHADPHGQIRKIQRYYHPVTWPFVTGVVASLIPVASVMTTPDLPLATLAELRRTLAMAGVPVRDVPLHTSTHDLGDEVGLLALIEQLVQQHVSFGTGPGGATARANARASAGDSWRQGVHPTARLIGPVVVADGAQIDADVVVVGPAMISAGASVGRDSVVAQCYVLPNTVILPGTIVRHRVVADRMLADQMVASVGTARPRRALAAGALPDEHAVERTPAPVYARVKPLLEGVVAAVLLLLLLPLLAVLALLVRLDSRGPIFYGATREGKDGRVFKCLKFRSMYVGADLKQQELAAANGVDGPQFKMDKDPRVTRAGRWMRALNVDELPQLLNVLRGDMSFVGPRPSPFRENQICVPWRQARLSVRPGITGLWQICRHDRSNGDFHQWIEYDLLYVRHFSWRLDARIFAATIRTLGGRTPVPVASIVPMPASPRPALDRPIPVPTISGSNRSVA